MSSETLPLYLLCCLLPYISQTHIHKFSLSLYVYIPMHIYTCLLGELHIWYVFIFVEMKTREMNIMYKK